MKPLTPNVIFIDTTMSSSEWEVRFAYCIIHAVKQLIIGRDMIGIIPAPPEDNKFSDVAMFL